MAETSSGYDLEGELDGIRRSVETLKNTELIVCVGAMVRFRIRRTTAKTMDVCFQPSAGYPHELVILDIKSKTLPQKFLDACVKMVEERKRDFVGKAHILTVFCAVYDYLESNQLCICAQEISNLKRIMADDPDPGDQFKVKQKQSTLQLRVQKRGYYLDVRLVVADDYPHHRTLIELEATNLPRLFVRYIGAQATEIARRCVEPSMLKAKKGQKKAAPPPTDFTARPSVEEMGRFVIENARRYPLEPCGLCGKRAFADNPDDTPTDLEDPLAVHRVYCGHVFHYGCIDPFMKTPPFTGGKKCPQCAAVIYHDKWKASEKTREERWAHQQAKARELEEVADFLA